MTAERHTCKRSETCWPLEDAGRRGVSAPTIGGSAMTTTGSYKDVGERKSCKLGVPGLVHADELRQAFATVNEIDGVRCCSTGGVGQCANLLHGLNSTESCGER